MRLTPRVADAAHRCHTAPSPGGWRDATAIDAVKRRTTPRGAASGARRNNGCRWTVRDKGGHVYKFGTLKLGAGKQAIIYTGDGTSNITSASTHLYWGREWYVWNNNGDKVILRRADGSLRDTCSYSGAGSKKYCLLARVQTSHRDRAMHSGIAGTIMSHQSNTPAGWYPDPSDCQRVRCWK
jgi:hypothetical protein